MTDPTLKNLVGLAVEIGQWVNGSFSRACTGNIERLTSTQIIVRNQHGNESRYHISDFQKVGGGNYGLSPQSRLSMAKIIAGANKALIFKQEMARVSEKTDQQLVDVANEAASKEESKRQEVADLRRQLADAERELVSCVANTREAVLNLQRPATEKAETPSGPTAAILDDLGQYP